MWFRGIPPCQKLICHKQSVFSWQRTVGVMPMMSRNFRPPYTLLKWAPKRQTFVTSHCGRGNHKELQWGCCLFVFVVVYVVGYAIYFHIYMFLHFEFILRWWNFHQTVEDLTLCWRSTVGLHGYRTRYFIWSKSKAADKKKWIWISASTYSIWARSSKVGW